MTASASTVVQILNAFLDQVDQSKTEPGGLCAPVLKEKGKVLTIKLPDDATYSSTPPQFPRSGRYCFPSGNFVLWTSLGWSLKQQKVEPLSGNRRRLTAVCKMCKGVVVCEVGPFLTIVTVERLADGSEHMRH